MKFYKFIYVAVLMVSLVGCATYKNGLTQEVKVHTSGVDNVNCFFESGVHKFEMIAPGKVVVERSKRKIEIVCRRAGYLDSFKTIAPVVSASKGIWGNMFNGIIPGYMYDMTSEAIYEYPDMIIMDMKRDPNRIVPKVEPKYILPKKGETVEEMVKPVPVDNKIEEAVYSSVTK